MSLLVFALLPILLTIALILLLCHIVFSFPIVNIPPPSPSLHPTPPPSPVSERSQSPVSPPANPDSNIIHTHNSLPSSSAFQQQESPSSSHVSSIPKAESSHSACDSLRGVFPDNGRTGHPGGIHSSDSAPVRTNAEQGLLLGVDKSNDHQKTEVDLTKVESTNEVTFQEWTQATISLDPSSSECSLAGNYQQSFEFPTFQVVTAEEVESLLTQEIHEEEIFPEEHASTVDIEHDIGKQDESSELATFDRKIPRTSEHVNIGQEQFDLISNTAMNESCSSLDGNASNKQLKENLKYGSACPVQGYDGETASGPEELLANKVKSVSVSHPQEDGSSLTGKDNDSSQNGGSAKEHEVEARAIMEGKKLFDSGALCLAKRIDGPEKNDLYEFEFNQVDSLPSSSIPEECDNSAVDPQQNIAEGSKMEDEVETENLTSRERKSRVDFPEDDTCCLELVSPSFGYLFAQSNLIDSIPSSSIREEFDKSHADQQHNITEGNKMKDKLQTENFILLDRQSRVDFPEDDTSCVKLVSPSFRDWFAQSYNEAQDISGGDKKEHEYMNENLLKQELEKGILHGVHEEKERRTTTELTHVPMQDERNPLIYSAPGEGPINKNEEENDTPDTIHPMFEDHEKECTEQQDEQELKRKTEDMQREDGLRLQATDGGRKKNMQQQEMYSLIDPVLEAAISAYYDRIEAAEHRHRNEMQRAQIRQTGISSLPSTPRLIRSENLSSVAKPVMQRLISQPRFPHAAGCNNQQIFPAQGPIIRRSSEFQPTFPGAAGRHPAEAAAGGSSSSYQQSGYTGDPYALPQEVLLQQGSSMSNQRRRCPSLVHILATRAPSLRPSFQQQESWVSADDISGCSEARSNIDQSGDAMKTVASSSEIQQVIDKDSGILTMGDDDEQK